MENEHEETLLLEARKLTLDTVQKIAGMHKEMYGDNHPKFFKMYNFFIKHLQDFYEELENSCLLKIEEMNKDVANKFEELSTLQQELKMNSDIAIDNTVPLNALVESLSERISSYQKIKTERLEKFDELLNEESDLCGVMDVPHFPSISGVPTEENIVQLGKHLHDLMEEKQNRCKTYALLKESIISLMKILEKEPATPFHNEIFMSVEGTFNLTSNYLGQMKNLEQELKQELEEVTTRIQYLKNKLIKLWNRINIEESHRVSFLDSIQGVGKSFQELLVNEIERCEIIKGANMKSVIESIRCDIKEVWDKLTYTEDQRRAFFSYYSDNFNDEVLELHEIELNRLQILFEEYKYIYDLAEKRESLWRRMQNLELSATDKNRFKNRGGQLLKEQKERSLLENNIPKTDSQLKNYLIEYTERTGNVFLWYGVDLLKKIINDWENRQSQKDRKGFKSLKVVMKKSPAKVRKCTPIFSGNESGATSSTDFSIESLASYTLFQEQLGCNPKTPTQNLRGPLKEINSPYHSSPASTKKCKTPKTPRRLLTPRQLR